MVLILAHFIRRTRTLFRIFYYLFCKLFVCGYCSISFWYAVFVIGLVILFKNSTGNAFWKVNLWNKQGLKTDFLYFPVILPDINESVSSISRVSFLSCTNRDRRLQQTFPVNLSRIRNRYFFQTIRGIVLVFMFIWLKSLNKKSP